MERGKCQKCDKPAAARYNLIWVMDRYDLRRLKLSSKPTEGELCEDHARAMSEYYLAAGDGDDPVAWYRG